MPTPTLPNDLIAFGPDANCTLALCPLEWSVYQYRPSLAANISFLVLFALAMIVHIYLGIRWRTWGFMVFMILGCLSEMIGYVGRIILYNNPFKFTGFIIQIVLITCAPVFYTAAVYITLSRIITHYSPELSRFNPKLVYWVFIPADIVCLILQAAGGALSTTSSGSSQAGIDVAMAGLILQVIVLFVFCVLLGDYMFRYFRSGLSTTLNLRMRIFFAALSTAVILILARCIYRCYELSQGYRDSDLISDEGLFIGLEGVLVLVAAFLLCFGHPGLVFNKTEPVASGQLGTKEREGSTQHV